jgi:hypothetical protein
MECKGYQINAVRGLLSEYIMLHVVRYWILHFDPENGGAMFLQSIV